MESCQPRSITLHPIEKLAIVVCMHIEVTIAELQHRGAMIGDFARRFQKSETYMVRPTASTSDLQTY